MTRGASRVQCAVVLLAGAACASEGAKGSSNATVKDSSGVAVVEVDGAALSGLPEWRLDSGALVIGSADGAREYLFHLAGMPWFFPVESVRSGHPHLHALLEGTSHLSIKEVLKPWRHGQMNHAALYNPTLGAAHYVVKEMGRSSDD